MLASLLLFLTSVASQEPRIQPMPLPQTLVLHKGDRAISIDGSVQDWPGLPPLNLEDNRQLSGTALGAYRGSDDVSAVGFLLWDEENLYFCAQVRDDWHIRLGSDGQTRGEVPPADSILLSFDPRRDTRTIGRDVRREEDREFWLAEAEGQEKRVVSWDRYRGNASFAEGAVAVVRNDPKEHRTVYEARIPWSVILPPGDKPAAKRVLDLNIVISDLDDPTDPLPQTRIGWTFGMGPRIDPGLYGSIMLLDIPADEAKGSVQRPDLPVQVAIEGDPVPGPRYWVDFLEQLQATQPAPYNLNTPDPRLVAGTERRDLLASLDYQCEVFPRVDFIEMQNRIHRRMNREVFGQVQTGLPFFWDHCLEETARSVAEPPPDGGFRIFRLPQGGWLVRSAQANFVIDPSGFGIEKQLWGAIDFALLTNPLDVTKRQDQLAVRMIANDPKRPIIMHLALHIPGFEAKDAPIVRPGEEYEMLGLKIKALGYQDEKGMVSESIGYNILWPDGTRLVVSGTQLFEDAVPAGGDIDLLLLSARHPLARVIGQRLQAKLTILDDLFVPEVLPGPTGRTSLEDAYKLQRGLRPASSMILAPGESQDVLPAKKK